MPDLKQHSATAAIAALVATAAPQMLPPKTVEKPLAVTVAASRFAWPDLSDAEISALGASIKWLGKTKVQIFCDGADCRDLQTSLDNAFEDAGVNSERAAPFAALGYGMQVLYHVGQWDAAFRLGNDIDAATGGRVNPDVRLGIYVPDNTIMIAIGKKPRDGAKVQK